MVKACVKPFCWANHKVQDNHKVSVKKELYLVFLKQISSWNRRGFVLSTDSNGHQRATLGFAKKVGINEKLCIGVFKPGAYLIWCRNSTVLPTPVTTQKPPAKTNVHEENISDFSTFVVIRSFEQLHASFCPHEYLWKTLMTSYVSQNGSQCTRHSRFIRNDYCWWIYTR